MKLFLFILIACVSLSGFGQDTTQHTVKFPSNEFRLSKTQMKSLDSLISGLDGVLNSSLYYIQGHTDNIGDRSFNELLSEKRCGSVKKYLVKGGIDENRIFFEKFGYDVPVATNETETGRADNRRTSLTIVTKLPSPDWHIKPQLYKVNSKNETIITTRNGCKITIPEDAFELPEPFPSAGKIELEVIEYNNPAYFIASGIPMSYSASGKLFMYHSEEMLSIKGFYKSELLALKDNAKITLNCRKVDSLYETGFYKFNLKEQKWFEDEKAAVELILEKRSFKKAPDKIPEQENKKESSPSDNKEETRSDRDKTEIVPEKVPELKLDTGWIVKPRIDTGGVQIPSLKKQEEEFDSLAYVCKPNCCDADYYIKLGQKLSEKPIDLTGLDLSFKSLANRTANRNYLNSVLQDTEERIGNKKYYPIKLKMKKLFLRRKAIVKFNFDKEKNPELKTLRKVKWVYRFKNNSEDYASFKKRTFHDIRIVYDPKTKTAAVKLEEKGKFCSITLKPKDPEGAMEENMINYQKVLTPRVISIYSCFWAFNQKYFARAEKKLSFINWVNYFNAHLGEMHKRYDSLDKNLKRVIVNLHCPCGPRRDSCVFKPDSLAKKLLKRSGPNRILIIGLGLYNFDKIVPVEDVIFMNAALFRDEKGRKIHPKESFLILGGINGMIHLDKTQALMLIANYKNTLFIVDRSNRRYKVVMEAQEDLRHRNATIVLQDITSKTQNLEGLERELMGK